jgi:hypothetical protein
MPSRIRFKDESLSAITVITLRTGWRVVGEVNGGVAR